jgi:hypothetical protein
LLPCDVSEEGFGDRGDEFIGCVVGRN